MTSIFSDEQRDSLMRAMTNPESNARKMMEQNQEIGISPDITTEILNRPEGFEITAITTNTFTVTAPSAATATVLSK